MPPVVQDTMPVTPAVISWARDRAGYSLQEATKYFKGIEAWENGQSSPSYSQLELMSEKFKCPVAVFFFPAPPDLEPAKQSFRTLTDQDYSSIPRTVKTLLRKAQAMQLNLAELNDQRNPAQKIITKELELAVNASLVDMARRVRDYLGVSLEQQSQWPSAEIALEAWRDAFTRAGIFVFKDAFHVEGYFGFCLFDNEFPIVYVNNSAAKSRQIFTLFHELAHLLFHTSGIDVLDDSFVEHLPDNSKKIEIICNRFAAAFLVPDIAFNAQLRSLPANRDTATFLANYYKVSREVIYRKMLNRRLISENEYSEAVRAWAADARPSAPGGNYYFTQFTYLGSQYIDLAFSRYHQRRFDESQLAEYLNIKPKSLAAFEQLYGR